MIVREGLGTSRDAADFARQLLEVFAAPIILADGRELRLTPSIGISVFPDDALVPAELLKQAGAAVAHVKGAGGKAFFFHTPSVEREAKARFALEDQLRKAIDDRALTLYYQPRVRLDDGRIEGVEALVRWPADDGSVREPNSFIGVAEAAGLIDALGIWVLEEACRQLKAWSAEGLDVRTMAVNVSAIQLRDAEFVDRVASTIAAEGIDPSRIELEITESATLDTGAHIDDRLRRLAALGVRVAIDDFGTGHSSLGSLMRLPVHTLKVDRSFLKDIPAVQRSRELVATIVSMGEHLGLTTVAEGVETEAQAKFLRRCGCPLAQGYLFGRPMPAGELTALLRAER